jgi:serine/threonine-protein kinase
MPQAVTCLERAIELDPNYAEALAWLADSYRLMGVFGAAPAEDVMPRAKAMAERALAIDDGLGDAWATLGAVAEQFDWSYSESDRLYARALETEPRNARARTQHALWRMLRGAIPDEEGLAQVRQGVEDDPLNSWVVGMLSYALGVVGRHDEALAEAERSVALDAESFFAQWNVVRAHAWDGRYDRALKEARGLLVDSGRHPWVLGTVGWIHSQMGRMEAARACYDELEARSRHEFVPCSWLAIAAGCAGLEEVAVRWAERAVAEHDPIVNWAFRLPYWEFLRSHPRFAEITRDLLG